MTKVKIKIVNILWAANPGSPLSFYPSTYQQKTPKE